MNPKHPSAFTLIELIMAIAILGVLTMLAAPEFGKLTERAKSISCMANLRAIGVSTRLFIAENDGSYPIIDTNPENPVYPPHVEAKGMLETLGPYGVTSRTLRCGADVATFNNFSLRGSSYEWRPIIDDEPEVSPVVYTRRGERTINPKRVRLCIDFEPVHGGRQNSLRGDGGVSYY